MQHDKSDLYERVTGQIVEAMEKGAGDYLMPQHVAEADVFIPTNASSSKPYRGINVVTLWATAQDRGYTSALWATYNQWKSLGSQVKAGEKATLIVFWKSKGARDDEDEEPEEAQDALSPPRVFAKGYYVFNLAQVESYSQPELPKLSETERVERADDFFRRLGARVLHGGSRAYYDPKADTIQMPSFDRFRNAPGYYSVLAHEMIHWSGAPSRLDRELATRFGSEAYAMEELIAELGAAFLSATLGIPNMPRTNHAAYLESWLKVLKDDKRALFHAASKAQQAADWMGTVQVESAAA